MRMLHNYDAEKLAHVWLNEASFKAALICLAFILQTTNVFLMIFAPPSNRTMRTKTIRCPSTGTRRTRQAVVDSRSLATETSVKTINKDVVVIGNHCVFIFKRLLIFSSTDRYQ